MNTGNKYNRGATDAPCKAGDSVVFRGSETVQGTVKTVELSEPVTKAPKYKVSRRCFRLLDVSKDVKGAKEGDTFLAATQSKVLYLEDKKSGGLVRLSGKPKLSKAEKKAAKRAANKVRESARQAQAELESLK